MAPARFTKDSSASDSSPTEPLIHQARVLRAMVSTATPIEARSRLWGVIQAGTCRDLAAAWGMPGLSLPPTGRKDMRRARQSTGNTL